jgi:ferritin-like metal-binding protein YciE
VHELRGLLEDALRQAYWAEKCISKAWPTLAKKTSSSELADSLRARAHECKVHIERFHRIFSSLHIRAGRCRKSAAIAGILDDALTGLENASSSNVVLDAGLLAAAQAVERHGSARYGSMRAWASKLDLHEIIPLIDETLQDLIDADLHLMNLATDLDARAANRA